MVEQNISHQESMITLAAIQFDIKFGQKKYNIDQSVRLIHQAADQGANLIVLPEMCDTGYIFNTRQECFDLCEPIPQGSTTQAWIKAAKERNVYIVGGLGEKSQDGTKLYNSAVLVGPDGYIGTHRKLHLWNEDKLYFEPGDLGFQVFHTPIGRIAMLVCYDGTFFECFRILSGMGADVVCMPFNSPDDSEPGQPRASFVYFNQLNARANRLHIVGADRIGTERGVPFAGLSCICGPKGTFLAGPASVENEEIVLATVNLMESRRLNITDLNVTFRDRRTDLYDDMLGSGYPKLPR